MNRLFLLLWALSLNVYFVTQSDADDQKISPVATLAGQLAAGDGLDLSLFNTLPTSSQAELLILLSSRNETASIEKLLASGLEANVVAANGETALLTAVYAENLESARVLLDAGADPELIVNGHSIRSTVDLIGSPEMKALFGAGEPVDIHAQLRHAVRQGDFEHTERLLADNADPNATDDQGYSAVLEATLASQVDLLEVLLASGGDPNMVNAEGITPAAAAIMNGDLESLRLLLANEANPSAMVQDVPLLTLAATTNQADIVEMLIDAGADPDVAGTGSVRPAIIAKLLGADEITDIVGDVPELDPPPDLLEAVLKGRGVAEALLRGADPNQRDSKGTPLVILATLRGDFSSVETLIKHDADVFARGPNGMSIIHAAAIHDRNQEQEQRLSMTAHVFGDLAWRFERDEMARLLAMRDDSGRSAFVILASEYESWPERFFRHEEIAQLIYDEDEDGVSPYIAAILSQNVDLIKAFHSRGIVPPELPGGPSVQDLARARGYWDVLALMPDDRIVPEGFELGASLDIKKVMQSRLKEWGYYQGPIDGIFGIGSVAALKQFFLERKDEIKSMVDFSENIRSYERDANNGARWLVTETKIGHWCEWNIGERKNSNDLIIACVRGGQRWNSFGVGYQIDHEDGNDRIVLFGAGGWKEYAVLR